MNTLLNDIMEECLIEKTAMEKQLEVIEDMVVLDSNAISPDERRAAIAEGTIILEEIVQINSQLQFINDAYSWVK